MGTSTNPASLRLVWLALLSSMMVYGALAWWTTMGSVADEVVWTDPMVLILAAMALGALAMAFVVPPLMVGAARRSAEKTPATRAPTSAFEVTPEVATAYVVRLALVESVAIFGLVACFLGQSFELFVPFGLVSVAGLLMSSPSEGTLRSLDRTGR